MYIGEIIKSYRDSHKLSQRAFAKRTSRSASYINTLEKIYNPKTGKPYSVTTDVAIEIANAMNMNIDDLLKMISPDQEFSINETMDDTLKKIGAIPLTSSGMVKIPVLGVVKAGYDYLAEENYIDSIEIDSKLAETGELFALKVHGDSMSPVFVEDDIVVVRKQDDFENGDIVVAIVNGNEATIKKGKKTESSILLQPLNPNYEPLIFTKEEMKTIPVIVVGIVKQLKREF